MKSEGLKTVHLKFKRETLVDQITAILEQRILKGELQPDAKISEPKIAEEFGVSRIPAREALQRLAEKNLVRMTHAGRVVNKFNIKEFQEMYELKNVIEAYGAMLGSQRATSLELEQIQEVVDLMLSQFHDDDYTSLELTNYKFHDLLVSFADNEKVIDTFQNLVTRVRWATSKSFRLPERPTHTIVEHLEIFEAYKSKQAKKVRELLERHSQANLQRVLECFKE